MRDRITFETNIPQVVALAFDEGRDVEGRFGDQVYYSLDDDRCMYVPPVVRDLLAAQGVTKGVPVEICKRQVKTGNRASIQWQVRNVGEEEPAAGAVSKDTPAANGNSSHTKAVPSVPHPITKPPASPPATHEEEAEPSLIERCLIEAMTAAMRAERAGQSLGCTLRWSSEDVRAIAITLYIQAAKNGGGR